MPPIDTVIRRRGFFLRRRDLLALRFTDGDIRVALSRHRIFRVRQGWYSVPDAPPAAIRAIRVGGRLTSFSALESYGLPVPRQPRLHIAVPGTASRLRDPDNRYLRLAASSAVRVHWRDTRSGGSVWRVSIIDALRSVLGTEQRDVAVACLGAAVHARLITHSELRAVFAASALRVRAWEPLVSGLDESHGETFFRLWVGDAGHACTQQVTIAGIGRFDFGLGPHLFVEIDGAQHDPSWTGDSVSSWAADLDRSAAMTIRGDRVLHFGYRQLYTDWPTVLAAIERAMADAAALAARRRRHPYRPRVNRKRRTIARNTPSG